MSAKIEMSAPSSATDAATYGISRLRPMTGMLTMQKVVRMPRSATSTSSVAGAKLSGELPSGGTNTFPVFEHFEPRMRLSLRACR